MSTHTLSSLKAADIMRREILPAHDSWDIITLAEFLVANGISGAPVIDEEGSLRGVVSVTDIARFTVEGDASEERRYAHQYYTDRLNFEEEELEEGIEVREDDSARVADIMTPSVFTVEESATLEEVSRAMVTNHIHRVFVSLISALDILASLCGNHVA
jgi:CBS domain-containing protein